MMMMMYSLGVLLVVSTAVCAAPTSAPTLTANEEMELIFETVPEAAQMEYYRILFNDTLTLNEMDQEWQAWAEKHGIADKWATFNAKWQTRKERFHKKILEATERLPATYKKTNEISANRNQTVAQLEAALEEFGQQFSLEFVAIGFMLHTLNLNEKDVINGGNIEVRNEIQTRSRRMRDFRRNNENLALLIPGPL